MDIDERIKFLVASTESLHDSCQELHAAAMEDRKRAEEDRRRAEAAHERSETAHAEIAKHQRAMLAAIRAYLEGMGGENA